MGRPSRYPPEVREQAIRVALKYEGERDAEWGLQENEDHDCSAATGFLARARPTSCTGRLVAGPANGKYDSSLTRVTTATLSPWSAVSRIGSST